MTPASAIEGREGAASLHACASGDPVVWQRRLRRLLLAGSRHAAFGTAMRPFAAERSSTPGVAYARVAFALVGSGRGGRRMRSSPVVVGAALLEGPSGWRDRWVNRP
jgi:hypothetical protein